VRAFMTENTVPLRGVQACVFDAYGTLFDFAAAARKSRDVLGDDIDRLTALWRDKQLQYTWLRAAQERHADFLQVTGDALDFALETIVGKSDLRDQLMSLFVTLDPFPEVPNVLRKLKTAGMRTAILSNGSPAMLDAAVKAARLEPLLDAVLSVEEVGVYKPHPKVYQLAVDRLAIPASAGMPTQLRHLGCKLCGATGTTNAASVYRGLLIEKLIPWPNYPPSWGQLESTI